MVPTSSSWEGRGWSQLASSKGTGRTLPSAPSQRQPHLRRGIQGGWSHAPPPAGICSSAHYVCEVGCIFHYFAIGYMGVLCGLMGAGGGGKEFTQSRETQENKCVIKYFYNHQRGSLTALSIVQEEFKSLQKTGPLAPSTEHRHGHKHLAGIPPLIRSCSSVNQD